MLQPIKVKRAGVECEALCSHWKEFPPRAAIIAKAEETTVDAMYQGKKITASAWQHSQFWAKNCGKIRMDAACEACPLVRFIEVRNHLVVMVSPDGKTAVPIVDATTLETLSKGRVIPDPSFKQGS